MKSNNLDLKEEVSILMNCYNGEQFLKESIESVLKQSYTNWKIFFVDNCSEDADVNETSAMSFRPSETKRISINTIDVMLHDLLLKHKTSLPSLLLYDEICNLFNRYLDSPNFDQCARLKSRKSCLISAQKSMNTKCLRPIDGIVQLHDKSLVTVPVFNIKHMIMSLLTDSKLMNATNFPTGYNILTGEVTNDPANDKYGPS